MELFADTLSKIEHTSSRKSKSQILTEYLQTLSTNDKIIVLNILLGNYKTNIGPQQLKNTSRQVSLMPETITITTLHNKLNELSHSSTYNKTIIDYLMNNSSPDTRNYIRKILLNNVNIGISNATILDAVSTDAQYQYNICNDVSQIINNTFTGIEPLIPIKPMLAKAQPLAKYPKNYIIEYKIDGFRCLFHKKGLQWRAFSRNCEDKTCQLMQVGNEIFEILDKNNIESVILDMELYTQNMKFQDAVKRGAKLTPYIFDILYLNGEQLITEPLSHRLSVLNTHVGHLFKIAETFNQHTLVETYDRAMSLNYEGVMIKDLDQIYIPHERRWIKLKRGVDTMDLVVIGAEYGEGKRANWYGSFILGGLYNNTVSPLCKVGTGFTDNDLMRFHNMLKPFEKLTNSNSVEFDGIKIFMEIDYFEITESPTYPCGKSLRFPVFKCIRTDKSLDTIQNLNDL